uniref:Putative secreted protein n=1 Tax=Anopheles marajoara TaxID=58244 RepID=A0A2M4C9M0_9DIPT
MCLCVLWVSRLECGGGFLWQCVLCVRGGVSCRVVCAKSGLLVCNHTEGHTHTQTRGSRKGTVVRTIVRVARSNTRTARSDPKGERWILSAIC